MNMVVCVAINARQVVQFPFPGTSLDRRARSNLGVPGGGGWVEPAPLLARKSHGLHAVLAFSHATKRL